MDTSTIERHPSSHTAPNTNPVPATPPVGRLDMYAGIHKALRLFMTRTLCRVGSTDPGDAEEVAATLDMVKRLLALCELHLKDENEFVHPALEAARAGSTARIAEEHEHHAESLADLRDLAGLVADSRDEARAAACSRLYRALALFVAENFQHMEVEETAHNALLWAHYDDAELQSIEQALAASIPPPVMFEALHWFLPALNAPERTSMLDGMRQGMPPEPFLGVLDIAQRTLSPPDHAKLRRALGLPPVPGLVSA